MLEREINNCDQINITKEAISKKSQEADIPSASDAHGK
jgi:hypothetical protein